MPPNSALVLGSGVSGLTTAVLLAQRGWKVKVLEAHDRPGGCLHTFTVGDFVFPTGYHYVGRPGADDCRLWRAVSGCDLLPACKESVVERYVAGGWSYLLTRGHLAWSATHGVPFARVGAMAGRLRALIILKPCPTTDVCIGSSSCGSFLRLRGLRDVAGEAGKDAAPLAKLQAVGCVGEDPPEMVGARWRGTT